MHVRTLSPEYAAQRRPDETRSPGDEDTLLCDSHYGTIALGMLSRQ
jgi:hypothetical protein